MIPDRKSGMVARAALAATHLPAFQATEGNRLGGIGEVSVLRSHPVSTSNRYSLLACDQTDRPVSSGGNVGGAGSDADAAATLLKTIEGSQEKSPRGWQPTAAAQQSECCRIFCCTAEGVGRAPE